MMHLILFHFNFIFTFIAILSFTDKKNQKQQNYIKGAIVSTASSVTCRTQNT